MFTFNDRLKTDVGLKGVEGGEKENKLVFLLLPSFP